MKKCPYCVEDVEDQAETCPHCKSAITKKCPFCAETISVMANVCRFCKSNLASPGGASPQRGPAVGAGIPQGPLPVSPDRPLGEHRDILKNIIFIFLTCGIWAWVWWYKIGDDINRHHSRHPLNPGLDLVILFFTCGIWLIAMAYKYTRAIEEIQTEEGLQAKDQATLMALLGFFLPILAKILIQDELNKHWKLHGQPEA